MSSTPFLKEIALILLNSEEYNLSETCVVFPNKRARLYLSRYMGEITQKPVWAPQYLTIVEMMEKISACSVADRLTLLFSLFNAYRNITGSAESFDVFYPYGETLLADFDEIDKYLVPASDLFTNLAGLKSIDGKFNYLTEDQLNHIQRFWKTFKPGNISENQEGFISLWESLSGIYKEFGKILNEKKIAYEGMAYRKAIDILNSNPLPVPGITRFVFVGFNALNTCEERLFRILKNTGSAEFFWDYDTWYTNTDIHEAGFFIRKNLTSFPQSKPISSENLVNTDRKLYFVPVSSNSGQTSVLPYIFDKLSLKAGESENTAVVLADEQLLLPALYALPDSVSAINVTMGYPVGTSVVFSLVDSLYELHKNARVSSSGQVKWYYKDVLSVMTNPLLSKRYVRIIDGFREKAANEHTVYVTLDDFLPDLPEEVVFAGRLHENACIYLLEVISSVLRDLPGEKNGSKHADPVQIELLFQVYTFLTRLQDILNQQTVVPGRDVLFRLIRKMLRNMHIPFSGEPLAGLQLLGILETRTLDFTNVILISANEGVLPKPSDKPSFIPYNLRAGFGLPTPEHQDAIYAYYFYRLIQRAQNVALVYDSSSGGMKTGERSRYLHQLQYEMRLPFEELQFSSFVGQIPVKAVAYPKDEKSFSLLSGYCNENGKCLSPSAINEYFNCAVKFYFHYIASLPQPEEVTAEIDSRMFGTILHESLNILYKDFGVSVITSDHITALLKNEELINNAVDASFSKVMTANASIEGYNLIVRHVIYKYIRQFLESELRSTPFSIIALESRFQTVIPLKVNGTEQNLNIGGIIDRVDLKGGMVRILDYKTGKVKNRFGLMESLFDGNKYDRNDAAFQVLLYCLVYDRSHPGARITPGLVFFRQSHEDSFSTSIKYGKEILQDFDVVKHDFELMLKSGLEKLFDRKVPFIQTENLKTCSYCAYNNICRRT
jgi:CRISPR/Cas system-associated exonuclease Cas4 (RecB family)